MSLVMLLIFLLFVETARTFPSAMVVDKEAVPSLNFFSI